MKSTTRCDGKYPLRAQVDAEDAERERAAALRAMRVMRSSALSMALYRAHMHLGDNAWRGAFSMVSAVCRDLAERVDSIDRGRGGPGLGESDLRRATHMLSATWDEVCDVRASDYPQRENTLRAVFEAVSSAEIAADTMRCL